MSSRDIRNWKRRQAHLDRKLVAALVGRREASAAHGACNVAVTAQQHVPAASMDWHQDLDRFSDQIFERAAEQRCQRPIGLHDDAGVTTRTYR
jgi:hypothetical protein